MAERPITRVNDCLEPRSNRDSRGETAHFRGSCSFYKSWKTVFAFVKEKILRDNLASTLLPDK